MSRSFEKYTMEIDGVERQAYYSFSENAKHIILVLHGAGGNALGYLKGNGWLKAGEQYDIIAPQGLNLAPSESPDFMANPEVWTSRHIHNQNRTKHDDSYFVLKLLEKLRSEHNLKGKLFIASHSMGSSFGFRLMEENPGLISGIFAISGKWINQKVDYSSELLPHIVYCNGDKDPLNTIEGGWIESFDWIRFYTPPIHTYFEYLARLYGADVQTIRHFDDTVEYEWNTAKTVKLIILKGHGHAWPKTNGKEMPAVLGPVASHFDATQEALAHFDAWSALEP